MNNAPESLAEPVRTRRNPRPKTLPKPRSRSTEGYIYLVSLIFFAVSASFVNNSLGVTDTLITVVSVVVVVPLLFLVELVFRALYILEEYQHLITRYENRYESLVKDVFYFSLKNILIVVCSIFISLIMYVKYNESPLRMWYEMGLVSVVFSLLSVIVLQRNLEWKSGPLYDSHWIENSNGLDYGSGMAHSFFHGYIKLIVPKTGTAEKHLEELMQDYEAGHKVKLEAYKLFILIPKSLYCPTSLKNENMSPSIEESSSLPEKVITVAGVRDRVYKNSVYKIKSDKGKRVYVCAEYATPLKTFKDVVSFNGEHSNHYKKHKNDIVLQFYLTLKKILKEHENCTDYCEPIFYDDKDENGHYKDVGQVLLQRIKKLRKSARESRT